MPAPCSARLAVAFGVFGMRHSACLMIAIECRTRYRSSCRRFRVWVGWEREEALIKSFLSFETDCTGCALCGTVCPHGCLDVIGGIGALIQADSCTSGAYCVAACPNGAIKMKWQRLNGSHSIGQWRAHSSE